MALLAVQGMAVSTAAFPSHHHGAVSSSSFGLSATVSFSRSRTTVAATAVSAPLTPVLDVYCGRGDRKTRRGKRFSHSYGNARPRNKKKGTGPSRLYAPPAPPRKDSLKTGRSSQSRLTRTSWKGWISLFKFSLISRFPRLV